MDDANEPACHALVEQARQALGRGDAVGAGRAAEQRLSLAPDDVDALEIRALLQQQRGEVAAAITTLQAILGLAPGADWARDDLVLLLLGAGRTGEAETEVRAALAANFDNPQAHVLLATLLSGRRDLPSGEWHFRRALALAGEHPPTLVELGVNLLEQGRLEEAEPLFARAEALAPANGSALAHWSRLCEVRGDLPQAQTLLERAEAAGVDMSLRRAVQLQREGRLAEALAAIAAAPGDPGGDALLARGRLREALKAPEAAWADFTQGKAKLAAREGLVYDATAVEAHFAALKAAFTRENLARLPKAAARTDVPQPIFILGFPRSGTTLTEQLLSSHSQVAAGGELPFMSEAPALLEAVFAGVAPFPAGLARLWTADARQAGDLLADAYLARARAWGLLETGKPWFTDKMPLNEIYLPLVRMAFPQAKIVRLVRHPLDIAVSVLANNLTHGFNCGYRIEDIAHHLAATHDLNLHYEQVLGADIHLLRYEALVADQKGETERLLAHLGLAFEPACLSFHENRRFAPTPSYAQVQQPLNDRSIGRWRAYAGQLAAVRQRLAPMLADLGYEA